eukprot:EG_transcript_26199
MGCSESTPVSPYKGKGWAEKRASVPWSTVLQPPPRVATPAAGSTPCSSTRTTSIIVQPLSSLPWAVSEGDFTSCASDLDGDDDGSCEGSLYAWGVTHPSPPRCPDEWRPNLSVPDLYRS